MEIGVPEVSEWALLTRGLSYRVCLDPGTFLSYLVTSPYIECLNAMQYSFDQFSVYMMALSKRRCEHLG